MLLQINDGALVVNLQGVAPVVGCVYFPLAPDPDEPAKPIEEQVDLGLSGTAAEVRATVRLINQIFFNAAERSEAGVGPRCFIKYRVVNSDAIWRSELLQGQLEWPDDKRLRNFADESSVTVTVALHWRRAPWWESINTQATLTNGNGSNNTSGLTIRLHDDGTAGHDNYVEIDGAEIDGDLPSPVELRLRNTSGGGVNYRNFYFAVNPFAPTLAHMIEGENRDSGYGSVVANSAASNGQYVQLSINGTLEVPWTIPAATLQKTQGRYLRLLAKFWFFDSSANIYVTAKIKDAGNTITLAQVEEEVRLQVNSGFIQNLGVLPFPPGGYNVSAAAHKLVLSIRTESLQTVSVDFMQLTPTYPTGCYREIKQLGNQVLNNEEIVDDNIESVTYHTESGQNHFIFVPKTEPLMLWPGRTQRIYVLADGTDVTLDHTFSVRAWFCTRRGTV